MLLPCLLSFMLGVVVGAFVMYDSFFD